MAQGRCKPVKKCPLFALRFQISSRVNRDWLRAEVAEVAEVVVVDIMVVDIMVVVTVVLMTVLKMFVVRMAMGGRVMITLVMVVMVVVARNGFCKRM